MKKNKEEMIEKDKNLTPEEIMEETLQEIFDEVKEKEDESEEQKECAEAEQEKNEEPEESTNPEEKLEEETEVHKELETDESTDQTLGEEDAEELEPKLSEEDGEEISEEELEEALEEELSDEERAEKKKKRNKILGIIGGSVLGILCVVYLGFAFYFSGHFYFYTTVNGVDYSLKTVGDVENTMKRQVSEYELTMKESDGDVEVIDGDDVDLVYKKGEELSEILKSQNPFLWPKSLWEKTDITASIGVNYDEAKLEELLNNLDCMKEENQVAPVDARPEFDGEKFVVKAEEIGSLIEVDTFKAKVAEYLNGFQDTLDLVEEECYVKAKYFSDSQEVLEACETMNAYLGANITYDFGETKEVVDGSVISQWLTTDENMVVTYNEDGVSQFVAGLAEKYNTYKKQRTFTSGSGNTVNVQGGNYGWIIDQAAEIEALKTNITNKETVTKEPAYKQKAASHGAMDWGNTYVEVDLTNQYMYLFVNGGLVTSSPIVTGKPSEGSATPQGVYSIRYCQRNAVLRGPKQEDGTYEWESPVSFWMPFNGGIGLHDATWQSSFGGNRYLTHGSHGCVNLPYSTAEIVFNNVTAGTPVVCHY